MTQRVFGVEQQSLRFWLSSWIPKHYPADTTYQLQPRDDGRWGVTLYLAVAKNARAFCGALS